MGVKAEQFVSVEDVRGVRRRIERTVSGLSWDGITFVILKVDDEKLMEGSGSLDPTDGLSAKVVVDGEVFISRHAPASLDDIVALLLIGYSIFGILLTNNSDKVSQLRALGLDIVEQVPLLVGVGPNNHQYLATKRDKMGHRLPP